MPRRIARGRRGNSEAGDVADGLTLVCGEGACAARAAHLEAAGVAVQAAWLPTAAVRWGGDCDGCYARSWHGAAVAAGTHGNQSLRQRQRGRVMARDEPPTGTGRPALLLRLPCRVVPRQRRYQQSLLLFAALPPLQPLSPPEPLAPALLPASTHSA